jgi:hypothetical protein
LDDDKDNWGLFMPIIVPPKPQLILDRAEIARAQAVTERSRGTKGDWIPRAPTANMQRALDATQGQPVPQDFGVPSGTRIANYDTILPDIDKELGLSAPPAFTALLTEGQTDWGHAASAYTMPGAREQTCMNIVGRKGQPLVNFMKLEEFLYGVDELDHVGLDGKLLPKADGTTHWKNPEGACYHRSILSVRVNEWPAEKIQAIDEWYHWLKQQHLDHNARFKLLPTPVRDAIDVLIRHDSREPYNCVLAASTGATMGDIMPYAMRVPRDFLIEIAVREGRKNPDNVDIVHYDWIETAIRTSKHPRSGKFYDPTKQQIAPLSFLFGPGRQLASRAAINVIVEPTEQVARMQLNRHGRTPSRI